MKDAFGRQVLETKTLLIHGGDCTGCSLESFNPAQLKLPADLQVVLVYSSRVADVPASYANLGKRFRVVADEQGNLQRHLNAVWFPRAYVLDSKARLTWLSPEPDRWPVGVHYQGVEP